MAARQPPPTPLQWLQALDGRPTTTAAVALGSRSDSAVAVMLRFPDDGSGPDLLIKAALDEGSAGAPAPGAQRSRRARSRRSSRRCAHRHAAARSAALGARDGRATRHAAAAVLARSPGRLEAVITAVVSWVETWALSTATRVTMTLRSAREDVVAAAGDHRACVRLQPALRRRPAPAGHTAARRSVVINRRAQRPHHGERPHRGRWDRHRGLGGGRAGVPAAGGHVVRAGRRPRARDADHPRGCARRALGRHRASAAAARARARIRSPGACTGRRPCDRGLPRLLAPSRLERGTQRRARRTLPRDSASAGGRRYYLGGWGGSLSRHQ